MRKWIAAGVLALALTGCTRYEPVEEFPDIEYDSTAATEAAQESTEAETEGGEEAVINYIKQTYKKKEHRKSVLTLKKNESCYNHKNHSYNNY